MNILLLGGKSALAKVTVPKLQSFSNVVTLGRADCDILMDIREVDEHLLRSKNIDVVVNMAAYFSGAGFQDITQAYDVNVIAALNVAQACSEAGNVHFVNISSICSFLAPESAYFGAYALTKRHSDELLQLVCGKFQVPLTILQPSQLYGNDDFRKHQPFLYHVVDMARTGQDICIYGKHDALRNYLYAEDMAKIIVSVVQKNITGCFPCMFPKDVSLSEVAQAAIDAFGSSSQIVFNDIKEDIPDNIFEKDFSIYDTIRWTPDIDIHAGLKMMVRGQKGLPS